MAKNYLEQFKKLITGKPSSLRGTNPKPKKAVMDDMGDQKNVMAKIYHEKLWGGRNFDFYSGKGSHSKRVVRPYVKLLNDFLEDNGKDLVVCDLGCGDFNVGQQLVANAKAYIAVDVVEDLIVRNQESFAYPNLTFKQVNLVEDELPEGDVALIRQVLQHLSNADIAIVTEKLKDFKYVFVTEHLPKREFVSNLDKTTGVGTRLSKGSGVVLHDAPFNLSSKSKETLLDISYNKGRIVTTCYEF